MNKRFIAAVLAAVTVLTGCGGGASVTYKDGTYEGKSSVYENEDGSEDGNGYGVVTLTIKDGKIRQQGLLSEGAEGQCGLRRVCEHAGAERSARRDRLDQRSHHQLQRICRGGE